jgi:hypothetical protein
MTARAVNFHVLAFDVRVNVPNPQDIGVVAIAGQNGPSNSVE